jgi:multiple sugar transport system permease protein
VLNQRDFVNTLVRTLVYTVSGTLLAIGLGLIAALVVKDQFPGRNIVRGFMLFPYIAPIVSVVLIWNYCSLRGATGRSFEHTRISFYYGDPIPGVALFSVRVPVYSGAHPGYS